MVNSKVVIGILLVIVLLSGCSKVNQNEDNYYRTSDKELSIENELTQKEPFESTKNHESTKEENTTETSVETNESNNDIIPIKDKIAKMTLDEKIGQMLIVGFNGYELNEDLRSMIQKYHVGGVILFRNNIDNPDQLLTLVNSIKSINSKKNMNSNSKVPLFISVDEEGGRVSRMPEQIHKLPSSKIIGEANSDEFSYKVGGVIANEIKAFGFNMDFAPVLDIFSNPQNTVIGDRAFGTDAEIVSKLGIQTMKGIREEGIIPVVKHFPGHGDTLVDSHIGLPVVTYDMKRLKSFEFVPFKAAIENKTDAIMIAHIIMKNIDTKNPASLSRAVITDILREQMNFDGVVITDDMTMGAIEKNYQIGAAVVKSVNAGSDIILVCHGYDNQVNAIESFKAAVENGKISEERVNESVYRILMLKNKYKLTDDKTESINIDEINKKIDAVLVK